MQSSDYDEERFSARERVAKLLGGAVRHMTMSEVGVGRPTKPSGCEGIARVNVGTANGGLTCNHKITARDDHDRPREMAPCARREIDKPNMEPVVQVARDVERQRGAVDCAARIWIYRPERDAPALAICVPQKGHRLPAFPCVPR